MKKTTQRTLGPPDLISANTKFPQQLNREHFYESVHGAYYTKMKIHCKNNFI